MKTSVCQKKTDWIIKLVWKGGNKVEMDRVWHGRHVREQKWICGFMGRPEVKDHLGDTGVDGTIILKYMLKK